MNISETNILNKYYEFFTQVNYNGNTLMDVFKNVHQNDEYNKIIHHFIILRYLTLILNVKQDSQYQQTIANLFNKFIEIIVSGINSPLSSFMNSRNDTNEIITLFFNKGVLPNMKLLYHTTKNSIGLKERGLFIDLLVDMYNNKKNSKQMFSYIEYPFEFVCKHPIDYSINEIKSDDDSTTYLLYCSKFLHLPHTIEQVTSITMEVVLIIIKYL